MSYNRLVLSADRTLRRLLDARDGHFRFESGHHGRLMLDLDALFADPSALTPFVDALAARLSGVSAVVGPLVGGALLAFRVAERLGAAFACTELEPAPAGEMYAARYRLPASLVPLLAGHRVAVVDDVINAGSAVRATAAAVRAAGGSPVAIAALLRLGETSLQHFPDVPLQTLAVWPKHAVGAGFVPRLRLRHAPGQPVNPRPRRPGSA